MDRRELGRESNGCTSQERMKIVRSKGGIHENDFMKIRPLPPLWLVLAINICWSVPLARAAVTLTLDNEVQYQKIEGWGSCLIFWSLGSTPYWNETWRQAYRDLGCNILRVDMQKEVLVEAGGNYATPVVLEESLPANVGKMKFSGSDVTVYGQMAQWLAVNALEPERVRIEGSIWSPPHWMKGPTGYTQSHVNDPTKRPTPWLSGGTNGDSVGGRLLTTPSNLEQFGRYVAAWVTAWEAAFGVPMYTISIQNESTFENPFDSCTYAVNASGQTDYNQYALALAAVREAFVKYGIGVKVMGPHVAQVGPDNGNPWGLNAQMSMIQAVKNHADPTLLDFLSFYNSNGYMGTGEGAVRAWAGYWNGAEEVGGDWGWMNANKGFFYGVKHDHKPTWASEAGEATNAWPDAIKVALNTHNALVHGNVVAHIYWQTSDTSGAETESTLLGKNNLNNPHNSKKYCAYKHFSRYVRPGARRIAALFPNGASSTGAASIYNTAASLNASAFHHPEDHTLTVILVNATNATQDVTIDLPGALTVGSLTAYRTKIDEGFAARGTMAVTAGQVALSCPAQSVTTLTGPAMAGVDNRDPDRDGLSNSIEDYLGLNRAVADLQSRRWSVSDRDDGWAFRFEKAKDSMGITAVVEWSTDLATWRSDTLTEPMQTADGVNRVEMETVLSSKPAEGVFFRLKVAPPTP